ncbi:hypothetical protein HUU40_00065 [candidate division KSB1 bacterium]|nr:hypothetical protein [candidate division KSB1 bacterium]
MDLKRGVDPVLLAALSQMSNPVLLVYLDWEGAPVYAHTGVGIIEWNGHEWEGVGKFSEIAIPEESSGLAMIEAVLTLAGVDADLQGHIDDNIQGRIAEIYVGALTDRPGGFDGKQNDVLIGTPISIFTGKMDTFGISTSKAGRGKVVNRAVISIATGVEARSAFSIYHNDENQRREYPDDTAGRLVILAYANAQKLTWPQN